MANSSAISRGSMIMGLCLPLAVLLGYLLAEPLDSTSIGVVVLLFSVLSIPILMRWHHPLLILSWNASINPFFIPGRPYVWMLMSLASCFFAVLSRATNPHKKFLSAPGVTWSLLCTAIVVAATAMMRGGIGLNVFGSERYGGKGYFLIAIAIIGYFALISQQVTKEQAVPYVAMFFLSGLTSILSNLAYWGGPGFYVLYQLFPPDAAVSQMLAEDSLTGGAVRIVGLSLASQAVWCWLLARYGLAGIFDIGRPWRPLLLAGCVFAGLLGGFRSTIIFFLMVLVLLFWLEKLWRSLRVTMTLTMVVTGLGLGLALFSERLPLSAQRALSFLPLRMDAATRQDAEFSTQWRIEIWKSVLPDVPRYLFGGKGYSLDPNDLYLAGESMKRGIGSGGQVSVVAGDYHNGPLSVVIPLGIYGVITIGWFWTASLLVMYQNYRYGREDLRRVNRFLLAFMTAKILFFLSVYGSLYMEMFVFTGLVGLSVSLNGGVNRPPREATPEEVGQPAEGG